MSSGRMGAKMVRVRWMGAVVAAGFMGAAEVWADEAASAVATQAAASVSVPAAKATLPQVHEYQKVLRGYMATLKEQDFAHGVTNAFSPPPPAADPEVQFRDYLLSLMLPPLIGYKRGTPSVNAPAKLFTLDAIEGTNAVLVPPCFADALIWLVRWPYAGNPYRDNRALKLRAFVTGAIHLVMLDDFLTKDPGKGRADWFSYELVNWGYGYPGFKDLLPPEVQQAYVQGLRRMAERVMEWGLRGEEPNLDQIAPVGLWYAAQAVNDPAFTARVEAHARKLLTDPAYAHPAGYFIERGGIDTGFGGQANGFAVWAALASGWDFARETVARHYRLRAHLDLPEPDGAHTGPTAFNARIGTAVYDDQWGSEGVRDFGAAMVTDEAAYICALPAPDVLAGGAAKRAGWCNNQIEGGVANPVHNGHGITNDEIRSSPWRRLLWQNWQFPLSLNAAYEHYRPGAYAQRQALGKANSPMLQSPFLRGETFLRDFAQAFFVTRQPTYAAIFHTGPVGRQRPDDGLAQFPGPLGFGGGQLAAFWTPEAGTVLQARRSAVNWDKNMDKPEEWRNLPIHAVSGVTADGKTFTSGRIADPAVTSEVKGVAGKVTVSGMISTDSRAVNQVVTGTIGFARTFDIAKKSVRVETTVTPNDVPLAELYETLPVFHREAGSHPGPNAPIQGTNVAATIEFQSGGKWLPATVEPQSKVAAIRITRFKGAVTIAFDQPQRVRLSPAEWQDAYLSRSAARNVLIDLLGEGGKTAPGKPITVRYTIAASADK